MLAWFPQGMPTLRYKNSTKCRHACNQPPLTPQPSKTGGGTTVRCAPNGIPAAAARRLCRSRGGRCCGVLLHERRVQLQQGAQRDAARVRQARIA